MIKKYFKSRPAHTLHAITQKYTQKELRSLSTPHCHGILRQDNPDWIPGTKCRFSGSRDIHSNCIVHHPWQLVGPHPLPNANCKTKFMIEPAK